MLPSSKRVKLNRVALKDVAGLKQVPPRRRVHTWPNNVTADSSKQEEKLTVCGPVSVKDTTAGDVCSEQVKTVLTDRVCSENVTDTAGNIPEKKPEDRCVGMQKTIKKTMFSHSKEMTGGGLNKMGQTLEARVGRANPTPGARAGRTAFTRCFSCTFSDGNVTETQSHPAPQRIKASSATSQTLSDLKLNVGKSSPKSKSRQRDGTHKSRVPRVAERDRSRGSEQSEGHVHWVGPSACCCKHGSSSDGNAVDTHRTVKDSHPSPSGLAHSGRSSRASGGSPCGDCKYISPQWKTLGKQEQGSSSPGPEKPAIEVKFKNNNTVTETSEKIVVWIGQYPKVTLCDVAQKCSTLSPVCGYMLPDFIKSKVVRCFKKDMRAGFWFGRGCVGNNKHNNEDGGLAKNKGFCSRVQSEMNQRHLGEHIDAQMPSSHTTCCFLKSGTSEDSAACSASLFLCKRPTKGECSTDTWNIEVNPGRGPHLIRAEIPANKRIKLGDSGKDGILLSSPDTDCISCKTAAKTAFTDKRKTCCWMSDDSQTVEGSAVKGNYAHKEPCAEMHSPTRPDATEMSSELFYERNEVVADELETFTCQRVRVYYRKNHSSCARTYVCWPFSNSGSMLTAHAGTAACPAEPVDQSKKSNSPINQNPPGSPSSRTIGGLTDASKDSASATTHPVSHLTKDRPKNVLVKRMSSYCSDNKNMEFACHLMENQESPAGSSGSAALSSPSQLVPEPGTNEASASFLLVNGPQTDSSASTPSPSELGLSEWETPTVLPFTSSPFTRGGLSNLSNTPPPLPPASFLQRSVHCKETGMTSCSLSPSALPHNSDSSQSWASSLLLPQEEEESDEEVLTGRCPPNLEPYYCTSPVNYDLVHERLLYNVHTGKYVEAKVMLPPLLSPVTSPEGSRTKFLVESQGCSDMVREEEEELSKGASKRQMLLGCHMPQFVHSDEEKSKDCRERRTEEVERVSTCTKPLTSLRKLQSSSTSDEDMDDGSEEESQDDTDWAGDIEQGNQKTDQVSSDPKIKAALASGVLTEPCSSRSSDEDEDGAFSDEGLPTRDEWSSPSKTADRTSDQTKAKAAGDTKEGILDEVTAYKQDILLVDVIQDDPELFENLPQKSLLKLGPDRFTETPKTRPIGGVKTQDGASLEFEQKLRPVNIYFPCISPDITEESSSRPWRPQCSSIASKTQSNICRATEKYTRNMNQPDANNNLVNGGLERNQPIQTVNSQHNHIPPLISIKTGSWISNAANMADFRRQKSNAYCRQYFSESLSCGFKMCRFQHVPVEGDEKFCIETVTRFTRNPVCLQKAGAVFTGYYHNNPPGVYFSMSVFLKLLWALLKAGMVSDVFSVLSVSLSHKIVPGHEFVLALFNLVREKGLLGFVPELMQLTFKMASAGLVLNLDCLDCVKNTPEVQQSAHPNSLVSVSGNHKLSTSAPFPEYLNLAHAIVEIELCSKQEDWRRVGEIFRRICQSSQRPNEVERISGRIAVALLSESKDKLSLPFAAFAETVCQSEDGASLFKSFLGRIGVSLMLRYHKTHQWAKGRRVVEVLSISKIKYSTLKGLFGNEDGASRCCLVTVATELFLLSGSVEGALNTLRENDWFLSSCSWPCEPSDVESRIRVLMRLAEKTSHRDTLDVLCNLPGLKEPNDAVDISRYCPLFNSHLRVCVDRQTLPVASDTVDFMLSKNLAVEPASLQTLLHKLGKQNLWLRAREVFRHSLNVGYYPGVSAPSGLMTLIVPCRLMEVELALAFEMFITVNATAILHPSETSTVSLSIVLKRAQSRESEYLSAGSRLLSAACIPQPKLIIQYTAVNTSKEQVFTLDLASARCWLRHNHLWANEVWVH